MSRPSAREIVGDVPCVYNGGLGERLRIENSLPWFADEIAEREQNLSAAVLPLLRDRSLEKNTKKSSRKQL